MSQENKDQNKNGLASKTPRSIMLDIETHDENTHATYMKAVYALIFSALAFGTSVIADNGIDKHEADMAKFTPPANHPELKITGNKDINEIVEALNEPPTATIELDHINSLNSLAKAEGDTPIKGTETLASISKAATAGGLCLSAGFIVAGMCRSGRREKLSQEYDKRVTETAAQTDTPPNPGPRSPV